MEASQLRGGYPGELPYQEACRVFHAMDPQGAGPRQGPSVYVKFTGCCVMMVYGLRGLMFVQHGEAFLEYCLRGVYVAYMMCSAGWACPFPDT